MGYASGISPAKGTQSRHGAGPVTSTLSGAAALLHLIKDQSAACDVRHGVARRECAMLQHHSVCPAAAPLCVLCTFRTLHAMLQSHFVCSS